MTKSTILSLISVALSCNVFATKSTTSPVSLGSNITTSISLNNTSGKVELKITAPSDKWFSVGFATNSMTSGDVIVYADNALTDRNFVGHQAPATDAQQDWTTKSDLVDNGVRTLIVERALINDDDKDYQFDYENLNELALVWAIGSSSSLGYHASRGFATADLTLVTGNEAESVNSNKFSIVPNPSNGRFQITTKNKISNLNVFNHVGVLVKTVNSLSSEVNLNDLNKGIYFLEIICDNKSSWEKIVIE